jgi:spiro-SPASM protein
MSVLIVIDKSVCATKESLASYKKVADIAKNLGHTFSVIEEYPTKKTIDSAFFDTLIALCSGYSTIIWLYGDEELVDSELCLTMLANHIQYYADYSFAEGYPAGLTAQIIKCSALPMLHRLATEQPLAFVKNFWFELIKRDINNFDIETEISPIDLRAERLVLDSSSKNNCLITSQILNVSPSAKITDICKAIEGHPELLWGYPVYYQFQITSENRAEVSYQPKLPFNGERFMNIEAFCATLQKISQFSGQAVIGLGYLGEVSCHPQLSLFIEAVGQYADFKLCIETSGVGWNDLDWQTLLGFDKERLSLIIMLDSLDEELYRKVRGYGFSEAKSFSERALSQLKEVSYIQTMRLSLLEKELESFYRHFTQQKAHLIIQKYNNYCGALPDNLVMDISPLKRHLCWALKRDMVIRTDGAVYLCRQDVGNSCSLGNIFRDKLPAIWQSADSERKAQLAGHYGGICENCDEYYLFSF